MTFLVPDHLCSVTVGGVPYLPDASHRIDVDPSHVAVLARHGIVPIDATADESDSDATTKKAKAKA